MPLAAHAAPRITTVILLLTGLLAACSTTPTPSPLATAVTTPPAAPAASANPNPESLTIAFTQGGAALTPKANRDLDSAARLYRDAKPEVMIIAGHSDTVGAEYTNLILSAKRADAVKHALVARGVPAERLQIVALGEAQPVPGVEPSRSAVVTWR